MRRDEGGCPPRGEQDRDVADFLRPLVGNCRLGVVTNCSEALSRRAAARVGVPAAPERVEREVEQVHAAVGRVFAVSRRIHGGRSELRGAPAAEMRLLGSELSSLDRTSISGNTYAAARRHFDFQARDNLASLLTTL